MILLLLPCTENPCRVSHARNNCWERKAEAVKYDSPAQPSPISGETPEKLPLQPLRNCRQVGRSHPNELPPLFADAPVSANHWLHQLLGVAGMACLQRSCQAHLGQEACPLPLAEMGRKSTAYNQLKRKLGTEYTSLSVLRTLTWMCVIPPLVNCL